MGLERKQLQSSMHVVTATQLRYTASRLTFKWFLDTLL